MRASCSASNSGAKIYDYIIIGAGPAGCFCGIGLKSAGKSVLIIEKNSADYGKVCGDGLSRNCVSLLKKLNFPVKRFEQAGAAVIHKRVIIRNGINEVTHFGFDDGAVSYGIPRHKTNLIFRNYAEEKGVEIAYNVEVTDIYRTGKLFSVSGRLAKKIVVACGSFSRLNILGKALKYNTMNMAVGISATISCQCDTEPCFLSYYDDKYKGQYAWIFKTDADNWNVGLWLREDRDRLREYFTEFLEEKLPQYFGIAFSLLSPPKGAIMAVKRDGIKSNPVARPKIKGVYYIGDVDMTSNEQDGEGICQAIMSGLILSDWLTKSNNMRALLVKQEYGNN